jgi:hypothetical protein
MDVLTMVKGDALDAFARATILEIILLRRRHGECDALYAALREHATRTKAAFEERFPGLDVGWLGPVILAGGKIMGLEARQGGPMDKYRVTVNRKEMENDPEIVE